MPFLPAPGGKGYPHSNRAWVGHPATTATSSAASRRFGFVRNIPIGQHCTSVIFGRACHYATFSLIADAQTKLQRSAPPATPNGEHFRTSLYGVFSRARSRDQSQRCRHVSV